MDECNDEYDPKTSFQCINGECVGAFVEGFYQFLDTGEKIVVSGLQKGKGKQQFIQSIDFYNISNLLQANTILERHKNDLKVMMTIDEHNFFKLQQGTFVLESVLKRDFRDQAVDLGFYKSPETNVYNADYMSLTKEGYMPDDWWNADKVNLHGIGYS